MRFATRMCCVEKMEVFKLPEVRPMLWWLDPKWAGRLEEERNLSAPRGPKMVRWSIG
jgi:hypothetical protein